MAGRKKSKYTAQECAQHNGFMGWCKNIKTFMRAVQDARTTTDEARQLAYEITGLAAQLDQELRKGKR